MYDLYKAATIEINLPRIGDMLTRQAQELEYISEKEFIVVNSIEVNENKNYLIAECDIFRYLEH